MSPSPRRAESDPRTTTYAHLTFKARCTEIIKTGGYTAICELGGGREPLFSPRDVADLGLAYTIVDVSQRELDRAPVGYAKVCADVCSPDLVPAYDFVFSRMLAEHVRDGDAMHRNIFRLLSPGGTALHFFPTLYHPAFVANRLLPTGLTGRLVRKLQPDRSADSKFPAYYSKCFGPTPKMRRYFTGLGYVIAAYRPFYGTSYLERIPGLRVLETAFDRAAARRQSSRFSAFAWLELRKPDRRAGGGSLSAVPVTAAAQETRVAAKRIR